MNKSIHGSLVHVQQERGVTFYFFEHFTSLAWLFLVRLRCFFLEGGGPVIKWIMYKEWR